MTILLIILILYFLYTIFNKLSLILNFSMLNHQNLIFINIFNIILNMKINILIIIR